MVAVAGLEGLPSFGQFAHLVGGMFGGPIAIVLALIVGFFAGAGAMFYMKSWG